MRAASYPFIPQSHREHVLWMKARMNPRSLRGKGEAIEKRAMKKLVKKTGTTLLTIGGVGLALAGAVKLFGGPRSR